jgi:DNA ligase-1
MFKPLLCPGQEPLSYPNFFKELPFPLLASYKLDGIRCIVKGNYCMSRSFKILPSYQVQDEFSHYEHFDGELIEGCWTDPNVYNRTQSFVMSAEKIGNMHFHVFDYTPPELLNTHFEYRLEQLRKKFETYSVPYTSILEHKLIGNLTELYDFEEEALTMGFEGLILRNPKGIYKQNRATWRDQIIFRLKRFKDNEGIITGFNEAFHNVNEAKEDALGYTERSYSKEGLVPANMLGSFVVRFEDQEIQVAAGAFNHDERIHIWKHREQYLNKILKFRHFAYGVKSKPRFPRAIGFRSEIDLGE